MGGDGADSCPHRVKGVRSSRIKRGAYTERGASLPCTSILELAGETRCL